MRSPDLVKAIGDLMRVLNDADPADKAEIHGQLQEDRIAFQHHRRPEHRPVARPDWCLRAEEHVGSREPAVYWRVIGRPAVAARS